VEAVVREWALAAAVLIDAAAVLIIVIGSVVALVGWVTVGLRGASEGSEVTAVRIHLARRLTLSLEFLIGSDIVRTAVTPSWTELGQLAAIVILRVVIIYSLENETKGLVGAGPSVGAQRP
jgi:uncharacterized membrane protein